MTNTLELDNVKKHFGKVIALDGVSFTISEEDIVALIGPNGAGKTTLYNVVTGLLSPTSGSIYLKGKDITGLKTTGRTKAGLARSFQITNIFEGMTVRRNVRIPVIGRSNYKQNFYRSVDGIEDIEAETDRILDLIGLEDIADLPCSSLSYGDRRRVEIGITLATDPDLVLLDEPTAGMNPIETEAMADLLKTIRDETDISFVVTEHDINLVFNMASRIIVLDQGEILADGSPDEIKQDEHVQSVYIGENA